MDKRQVVGLGALHPPFKGYLPPSPEMDDSNNLLTLESRRIDSVTIGKEDPSGIVTLRDLRSGSLLCQGKFADFPKDSSLCASDEIADGLAGLPLAYRTAGGWRGRSINYTDFSFSAAFGYPGPVREIEKIKAIAIVRDLGVVERHSQGQMWTVTSFGRPSVPGASYPVGFTATWKDPVETNGPWIHLRCNNTKRWTGRLLFKNVTGLYIAVDLEDRKVVGIRAVSAHDDSAKPVFFPLVVGGVTSMCPPWRGQD